MGSAQELLSEFQTLPTSEERLEWLVSRQPNHAPLAPEELRDDLLVPECISKLWFRAEQREGVYIFRVHSESKVVQSVAAFICDLYSDLSAEEIVAAGITGLRALKLEELLSFNRRRTIERVWTKIHSAAVS